MILCSKCHSPVANSALNKPALVPCDHCRAPLQAEVFPAFHQNRAGTAATATAADETEAGCFYHPHKKAVVPCDRCGRFLCGLCDVEMDNKHFCPACLSSGKKKNVFRNLENHRVLYDSITLGIAVFPLLFLWPTLITAPISMFMVFRYWNAPGSIVRRTKFRYITAFVLSGMQMGGWLIGAYFLLPG